MEKFCLACDDHRACKKVERWDGDEIMRTLKSELLSLSRLTVSNSQYKPAVP